MKLRVNYKRSKILFCKTYHHIAPMLFQTLHLGFHCRPYCTIKNFTLIYCIYVIRKTTKILLKFYLKKKNKVLNNSHFLIILLWLSIL